MEKLPENIILLTPFDWEVGARGDSEFSLTKDGLEEAMIMCNTIKQLVPFLGETKLFRSGVGMTYPTADALFNILSEGKISANGFDNRDEYTDIHRNLRGQPVNTYITIGDEKIIKSYVNQIISDGTSDGMDNFKIFLDTYNRPEFRPAQTARGVLYKSDEQTWRALPSGDWFF